MSHPVVLVRPTGLNPACTDQEFADAVIAWLTGAPDEEVAKMVKSEMAQLRYYQRSPQWNLLVDTVREQVREFSGSRMLRIANRSLELIEERIEGGDPIYDMEGTVIGKRAVRVKDLSLIAAQMTDRHALLQNKIDPSRNSERPLTLSDLAQLLEKEAKMARFSQAKEIDSTASTVN